MSTPLLSIFSLKLQWTKDSLKYAFWNRWCFWCHKLLCSQSRQLVDLWAGVKWVEADLISIFIEPHIPNEACMYSYIQAIAECFFSNKFIYNTFIDKCFNNFFFSIHFSINVSLKAHLLSPKWALMDTFIDYSGTSNADACVCWYVERCEVVVQCSWVMHDSFKRPLEVSSIKICMAWGEVSPPHLACVGPEAAVATF